MVKAEESNNKLNPWNSLFIRKGKEKNVQTNSCAINDARFFGENSAPHYQ